MEGKGQSKKQRKKALEKEPMWVRYSRLPQGDGRRIISLKPAKGGRRPYNGKDSFEQWLNYRITRRPKTTERQITSQCGKGGDS